MKTVLLTGFEPFGGEEVNPSWLAVRRLNGRTIRGHRIVARRLPTAFGQSLVRLRHHLRRTKPALVICVGQAGGRAAVTPECVAVNVDNSRLPDNAGWKPANLPVVPGGPPACRLTLPVWAIVRVLRRRGIPATVSRSAGTFVCNHVFYGLMHDLAQDGNRVRGGFIHVPWLPEQAARAGRTQLQSPIRSRRNRPVDRPCLPLRKIVAALTVAVRESLRGETKSGVRRGGND